MREPRHRVLHSQKFDPPCRYGLVQNQLVISVQVLAAQPPQQSPDGDALRMSERVSEYLRRPLRVLYDACGEAGQDDDGRRCPTCVVNDICQAELARRRAAAGGPSDPRPRWPRRKGVPPAGACWGARKKEAVVVAIRQGVIARAAAYERYRLSPEELASWEAAFDRAGAAGLLATKRITARLSGPRSARSGAGAAESTVPERNTTHD